MTDFDSLADISGLLIPCPFVYSTGRKCKGHVIRVEAYKADLAWDMRDDGSWQFGAGAPRSHYHLFCSEKGNHAGVRAQDGVKLYLDQLPDGLLQKMQIAESGTPLPTPKLTLLRGHKDIFDRLDEMVRLGIAEWGAGKKTIRMVADPDGQKLAAPIILAVEANGLRRIS